LIAWQKAMCLAEDVYKATSTFPKEETYGLTSQMRRAVVSVASNIAEGQARRSRAEFLHFLSHAGGSLAELETRTTLSGRLGYLSSDLQQTLIEQMAEAGRILNGLRRSLLTTDTDH
jgi:four helix bundle protein